MAKTIIDAEVSYGLCNGIRMQFPPLYLGLAVAEGIVSDASCDLFVYDVSTQSCDGRDRMVLTDWAGNEYVLADSGAAKVRAALAETVIYEIEECLPEKQGCCGFDGWHTLRLLPSRQAALDDIERMKSEGRIVRCVQLSA